MKFTNIKAQYLNQSRQLTKSLKANNINQNTINNAKNHLINCLSNPTIGLLAEHKTKTNYINPRNIKNYNNNLYKLKNNNLIQTLLDTLENRINKLYPKTKEARQHFINTEQVVLNKVNPKSKNKTKDKISIFFRNLAQRIIDES